MNDETFEAEELNDYLDRIGPAGFSSRVDSDAWSATVDELLRADHSTPVPDPRFVLSLRAAIDRRGARRTDSPRSARQIGIVARPLVPARRPTHRRLLTACVIAASLLLAIFASYPAWPGGDGHSLGVPGVQASSTAIVPTPTPTPYLSATVASVQPEPTASWWNQ
jgi:hypothetical protein